MLEGEQQKNRGGESIGSRNTGGIEKHNEKHGDKKLERTLRREESVPCNVHEHVMVVSVARLELGGAVVGVVDNNVAAVHVATQSEMDPTE